MFTLNGLRNLTILLFAVLVAYFSYLAFYPFPTVSPRVQPYKVLTPNVHISQPVVYEANYCKYTDAPALVIRNMISDKNVVIGMPTSATNLPKGCHIAQSASTVIPLATPPGRYKVIITLIYRVNALRDISSKLETEYFNVLP